MPVKTADKRCARPPSPIDTQYGKLSPSAFLWNSVENYKVHTNTCREYKLKKGQFFIEDLPRLEAEKDWYKKDVRSKFDFHHFSVPDLPKCDFKALDEMISSEKYSESTLGFCKYKNGPAIAHNISPYKQTKFPFNVKSLKAFKEKVGSSRVDPKDTWAVMNVHHGIESGIFARKPYISALPSPKACKDPLTCRWRNPLCIMHKMPGLNEPAWQIGGLGSSSSSHIEDMGLRSINFCALGGGKEWRIFDRKMNKRLFEELGKELGITEEEAKFLVRGKSIRITVDWLKKVNLLEHTYAFIQNEGEFVEVGHNVVHTVTNLGFSANVSWNYLRREYSEEDEQIMLAHQPHPSVQKIIDKEIKKGTHPVCPKKPFTEQHFEKHVIDQKLWSYAEDGDSKKEKGKKIFFEKDEVSDKKIEMKEHGQYFCNLKEWIPLIVAAYEYTLKKEAEKKKRAKEAEKKRKLQALQEEEELPVWSDMEAFKRQKMILGYYCEKCDLCFKGTSETNRHRRYRCVVDLTIPKKRCRYCPKSFYENYDLKRHEKRCRKKWEATKKVKGDLVDM